jgi:sugar/nucleoside kinase (ribokinase family)
LLPHAKQHGVIIACDLQDAVSLDDPYRHDFINYADILFCSAVNYRDPADLIRALRQPRPWQIVIVGMGAQGCAVGTKDGIRFFPAVELDAPVIDTNGAGDGLAVGFLTSFVLEGYGLADSIWRGQIAARYTCTQKATTSHLITPAQLDGHFRHIDEEYTDGVPDQRHPGQL